MTSPEIDRPTPETPRQRVCIVGISGKLGQYLATHALDRGYEVVGVCRPKSVSKLGSDSACAVGCAGLLVAHRAGRTRLCPR